MDKYEKKHNRTMDAYERMVGDLYKSATKEAALLGMSISDEFGGDKLFSFADFPQTKKKADKLLKTLAGNVQTAIVNGVRSAWTLANNKNDEICNVVFGDNARKLPKAQYRKYYSNNGKALEAFESRKVAGLNLSDRVWKYTDQFKEEIELGLSVGIKSGMSADDLQRELRVFLQHPDKLFRRVRDEFGQLRLSKRAAAYHPGRGVYRSSYKNARRLAATEINIAYRTADYTRWQQLDFVVGIEIKTSNNHPEPDICDDLKGKYPKDFKFTGWHPHCRCHAETILKTEEELMEDNRRILLGEEPREGSVNEVREVPQGFTKWVEANKERIVQANSMPYFITDNASRLSAKFGYVGEKLGRKAEKRSREFLEGHKEKHDYSPEQMANFEAITKATGYERGKPMTFEEADNGQANVFKDKENCAVCVLVHELRLRGFNITATRFSHTAGSTSEHLSKDTCLAWLTRNGTKPVCAEIGGTEKEIVSKLDKQTTPIGSRYHLGWDVDQWFGHIITAERTKHGLILYDPQRDCFMSIGEILHEMLDDSKLQLLRVDRLLVRPEILNAVATTLE